MKYNPYIIGVLRDVDGMEMDDRYVLYKYREFSDNESTKMFALDSYRKHFDSLCCDTDKCREMKKNWELFCQKKCRAASESGLNYNEATIKKCLKCMYGYIMTLKKNIEACCCCENSTICDGIQRDIEQVSAALLACMSSCGVVVPTDE